MNHLLAWAGFFGSKVTGEEGMVVFRVIFWSIWRKRNRRVFQGVETALLHLKDYFFKVLFVG